MSVQTAYALHLPVIKLLIKVKDPRDRKSAYDSTANQYYYACALLCNHPSPLSNLITCSLSQTRHYDHEG